MLLIQRKRETATIKETHGKETESKSSKEQGSFMRSSKKRVAKPHNYYIQGIYKKGQCILVIFRFTGNNHICLTKSTLGKSKFVSLTQEASGLLKR